MLTTILENKKQPWIKSTCPYCGVGCGVEAQYQKDGQLIIRGDNSHPANYGRLCSKGLALANTVVDEGRLVNPVVEGQVTNWDVALNTVAERFKTTIQQYGPDSVAFYVSGQLLTEDYYVANKLMKGYIGSGNIDTNSRLCMSSSVAGHKRAFGSDTVPNCYADIELADMVVLTGSNLAWCHPVIYQRLKAAKKAKPSLKIIVIDPRETDTCELADLHLAILPGTDVALFNGLLSYLHHYQHTDKDYIRQHTRGFAAALHKAQQDSGIYKQHPVDYLAISRITGIPVAYLDVFYRWFANTEKVVTVYSQGINQSSSGTDKVNSIINCHLATGRIGVEGAGPFSITGQPNAMGGREVGGLANTLAAHMEFGNDEHYHIVSEFWGTDNLAKKPGLNAIELFDAVANGDIKAIWIIATNPAVSMPDSNKIQQALQSCPLVVVSDCIADTDTTRCADILLPAMAWAEKSGTVTNSERRISRQRSLIASTKKNQTQAKPDWWIVSQVALRMGYSGFDFTSEADVFREYTAMTGYRNNGARDLDLSALKNLSSSQYQQLPPQQWPLKEEVLLDVSALNSSKSISQKRFFANGGFYTASGKGQFIAVQLCPPMTAITKDYSLILNTGRIRDQWHTMTRTALARELNAHQPEPYVQVNPQDARCFNLRDGGIAELSNAHGFVLARVQLSRKIAPGQIFMPIHWGNVESSHGKVGTIVNSNVDPISAQPELKFTPVAIKQWVYHSEGILLTRTAINTDAFDYWVRRRVVGGFIYYIAQLSKADLFSESLQQLTMQTVQGTHISFSNDNDQQYRQVVVSNDELAMAYLIGTNLNHNDYSWFDSLLTQKYCTEIPKAIISAKATGAMVSGKSICVCKQVGELTIINAIAKYDCNSVEDISLHTFAGTGCGSCIPAVNEILSKHLELKKDKIA